MGPKTGMLSCAPRSTKPACVALAKAGGDPARLAGPSDMACTMEYNPVHVKAMGVWDGRRHDYDRTFSNGCEMAASTGPVFQF
ncbi:SSI family serine proteinase inhibitor [Nonomuraea lactucae]|uniref:SSI family serine proteinase inhibitor n=1 Tax=Nonomuraea lactucae TaxID=2249762 RepID=UPI001F06995B|nr:SSI family serine proteinase inhibitor [Nonomuraea lactucae]